MPALSVPSFGGGVVLEGAADTQRTDELQACDSYDIGPRGQLVAASDVSGYVTINDGGGPAPWTALHSLGTIAGASYTDVIAIGEGIIAGGLHYLLAAFALDGAVSPIGIANLAQIPKYDTALTLAPLAAGCVVTVARFSGIYFVWQGGAKRGVNVVLINLGVREGFANVNVGVALGLYALLILPSGVILGIFPIGQFDALGTGAMGQQTIASAGVTPGTNGLPLWFRGIAAFNGIAMGWGFDNSDIVNADGPARLMFSNQNSATVAGPLTWGNDNEGSSGNRAFTDSDAIVIGDVGERIRAGITWNKRFWIGTNRALHYLAGYGRNSFLTDGANPIAKAENVIGAHALIEGPDGLLYGVGDQGLWRFDGATFDRLHKRLRRFDGHSPGWWDLIWTDRSRSDVYPAKTNQDLVWMVVDWDLEQVIVGIPWCSAANGYGFGTDTVLVKFHTRTGGFTRQVFTNVQFTAAEYVRREGQFNTAKFLGTATAGQVTLERYGYTATPNLSPPLPVALPTTTMGEYAQFGPNGVGVYRKVYLTLAWESAAALPLVFTLTPSVDQQQLAAMKLTIAALAPALPADGDLWLDTSGTDANLGNANAGVLVSAASDYVLKRWRASLGAWSLVPGAGQKGTRATVPIAMTPTRGSRFKVQIATSSAAGRYQIEGIGDRPELVSEAA